MRLYFGAPRAQNAPEDGKREPRNPLGAKSANSAEDRKRSEREEQIRGTQPDIVCNHNAQSKQPRRVKERNSDGIGLIESERTWPVVDLFSFHQARI